MMKLVLVSFIVIFSRDCRGFPDGLEARDSANRAQQHTDGSWGHDSADEDQHFLDEVESGIYVDEDQHLEKGKALNERESRGNSVKKMFQRLVKELQSVIENQGNITDAISIQDAKLDSLNSAVSNQDSNLVLMSSAVSNQSVELDSMSSAISNQDSKLDSLNSAVSNQDSNLVLMSSAVSNQSVELDSLGSAISSQSIKLDNIRDCPIGFFRYIPSNQCVKLFTDTRRNWTLADAKCRSEGLQLAQPDDPVSVRSYVVKKTGTQAFSWLGARGDGSSAVWQRGGQAISNTDPYWYRGSPYTGVSTDKCLSMLTGSHYNTNYPNTPYYMGTCSGDYMTLCELVME